MTDRTKELKDERAAVALSRLPAPPIPEGLAARIAARAVATPQEPRAEAQPPANDTAPAVIAPDQIDSAPVVKRSRTRQWYGFTAAASVVVCLMASTVFFLYGKQTDGPVTQVATSLPAKPAQVIVARPLEQVAIARERKAIIPSTPSKTVNPVQQTKPAVSTEADIAPQLAAEVNEAAPPESHATTDRTEQLAQSGPQIPQDSALGAGAVYGPPAPGGFGISGTGAGGTVPATRGSAPGLPSTSGGPVPRGPVPK